MVIQSIRRLLATACLLTAGYAAQAAFVIPGSVTGGTATNEAGATDNDYLSSMDIAATGGPGNRVSFIVDLEGTTPIYGVALYGNPVYESTIQMLSDEIIIEGALNPAGPWTQLGSLDVGHTRPTDPDPAVGGENPFTGGNGRYIPTTTQVNCDFLRISGDQGFDNNIRVWHLQINPRVVIHRISPIHTGTAYQPFDFGGGAFNSRAGVDMVDGLINTRTFLGTTVSLTLDLGYQTSVQEFRLLTSDNDAGNIPENGSVYISSTDDPGNFDTLETDWDATGVGGNQQAVSRIVLPSIPDKRFYQLNLISNRDEQVPNGTGPTLRVGEIEFRTSQELPVSNATVTASEGMTSTNLGNGTDKDYNTYIDSTQDVGPTAGAYIVDLGGLREVSSVGIYGNWQYMAAQNMLSDDIVVEAGNSASGPWTQIGSINVGNTRPTNPNPAVGGSNPWTGGNGRRVPCTPTSATHLRVSGGFGFDNTIRPYEILVNPGHVAQRFDPVDQGQTLWDIGGGALNSRSGQEYFDGDIRTRVNPRIPFAVTIDTGNEPARLKAVRFYAYESDISLLPTAGVVRISSMDNPENMDIDLVSFSASYVGGGVIQVDLPNQPNRRYVQVDFSQSGRRAGEIEVLKALPTLPQLPVELSDFVTE